jgi:hypothetical protein
VDESLIICPTRGRPDEAIRLADTVHATSACHLAFGIDEDDPQLARYQAELWRHLWPGDKISYGPPGGSLASVTNRIALKYAPRYRYLASLGDDMVPETPGWDQRLIEAIAAMPRGVGAAYPDDRRRKDVPEAIMMDRRIVQALGYMMIPGPEHFYVDDGWRDLLAPLGILAFVPEAVVPHLHYEVTGARPDETYLAPERRAHEDRLAWKHWQATRLAADAEKLRALIDSQATV